MSDAHRIKKPLIANLLTTTQRDNIVNPEEGMVIYNLTTNRLNFYNGTIWGTVAGSGEGVVDDVYATLYIANVQGSTNTSIWRFNSTDLGSANAGEFTINQSVADGDSITINEDGTYACTYCFGFTGVGIDGQILGNDTTTGTDSVWPVGSKIAASQQAAANQLYTITNIVGFVATDVVRVGSDASSTDARGSEHFFTVRKL